MSGFKREAKTRSLIRSSFRKKNYAFHLVEPQGYEPLVTCFLRSRGFIGTSI